MNIDEETKQVLLRILLNVEEVLPKIKELVEKGEDILTPGVEYGIFWVSPEKTIKLNPGLDGVSWFWKKGSSGTINFRFSNVSLL